MAAGVLKKHRVVGRYFGDAVVDGQTFHAGEVFLPLVLMPSPSHNPLPGCSPVDRLLHFPHHLIVGRYGGEVEVEFFVPGLHEMPMAFNETRRRGIALEFYDARVFADVAAQVVIWPGEYDGVAADGYRFYHGIFRVH